MIHITRTIAINESEIQQDFIRASGPGGQNVNKAVTAVQLRLDVANFPFLPNDVRERLISLDGTRITEDGILVIDAQRFRTQGRNCQDAIDRLVKLIRNAAQKPKIRHKTRLTLASKMRWLESKRRRAETKCMRGSVQPSDE